MGIYIQAKISAIVLRKHCNTWFIYRSTAADIHQNIFTECSINHVRDHVFHRFFYVQLFINVAGNYYIAAIYTCYSSV